MARKSLKIISTALLFTALAAAPLMAQSGNYRNEMTIYDDGQGVSLRGPSGVACSGDRMVIADSGNNRLLFFELRDGAASLTREVKLARQINPTTVQFGAEGQLLVFDSRAKEILRFGADGSSAGKVDPRNVTGDSRIILKSFRTDGAGDLYLLDVFGRRVLVLDKSGAFRSQVPFPKEYGYISDLAVDRSGRILIIDSVRSRVFASGPGTGAFEPLSGNLQETLPYPTRLETDSQGVIYVVDEETSSIGILRRDGSVLKSLFNRGRKEGLLYYPAQICVEDGSRIVVADRDNNRVQVFAERE